MRDTTKYLLQAIGSIAGEIRELRSDLKKQSEIFEELIKSDREYNRTLNQFKDAMDNRLVALQTGWERHLNNHLYNQENLIIRTIKKELFPKEKKIKKIVKKKAAKKKAKKK